MERDAYEAPKVEIVGSISDVTQIVNKYSTHRADGYVFHYGGQTFIETS